jgi:hypothetical protein
MRRFARHGIETGATMSDQRATIKKPAACGYGRIKGSLGGVVWQPSGPFAQVAMNFIISNLLAPVIPPWEQPDAPRELLCGVPVLFRTKLQVLSAADGWTKYAVPPGFPATTTLCVINFSPNKHTVELNADICEASIVPGSMSGLKPNNETLYFHHSGPSGLLVEVELVGTNPPPC